MERWEDPFPSFHYFFMYKRANMNKIFNILLFLFLSLDVFAEEVFFSSVSLKVPGNDSETYVLKMGDGKLSCDKPLPLELSYTVDDISSGIKVLNLHIAATSDAWFRFQAKYQTPVRHTEGDFYLPGFWYHQNLRSPKESPSFHTSDSWTFREDRLSTPLTCVQDPSSGHYYSVLRIADYKADALTTHKSGEIMLSGKSDVGYLGFENIKGHSALCFGYPYQETPTTYIRKRTLSPATYAFAFLPKGESIDLKWQIREGETASFASLVAQMWEYSFDTYHPQKVETPYSDDFLKETLTNYFRQSFVESDYIHYTSGEGLVCADCEPKNGAQVGFVGRVLLNAFNSLEYGTAKQSQELIDKGQIVFSDYLTKGLAENGLIKEHINTQTRKTEQACSIRRQSEGIYAVLLYLDFEKRQGRKHPEWESAMRTLLDLFLSIQNEDGSFPRRFDYDLSLIDATGGSTGSATLPLIMGYKYFKDKKYLEAACRTVDYLEKEIISKSDYFSSTLDARCEDKEAAIAAATATYYMALVSKGTRQEHYARLCKQASYFALSWYYTWDVPFSQGQMLGDLDFKSRGWGNVSAENNHIDVFVFEFGNVLKWLSGYFTEPRFEQFLGVMTSSMKQLLPIESKLNGIAKVGFYPEVVQHTNWDYGRNGKGYYNDIFAPGWTVASLWELYTPGRTERFLGVTL